MSFIEAFQEIQALITQDLGNRGLTKNIYLEDFRYAIEELYEASMVMIVTGFCIKETMTGETDGPLGAASLANGLLQLDKKVVLITDKYSQELIEACCKSLNIKIPIEVVPFDGSDDFCRHLLEKYQPSHIVALERPGRAMDGGCYSMDGEDLRDIIPNTDLLLRKVVDKNIVTIAIGDGGNEMGMGKVRSILSQCLPEGEKISAITAADYLVIADVSNWGGHAFVAGLSLLASQRLLHNEEMEERMLGAIVHAGAVDGCTKERTMTVDGLSLETNLLILNGLHTILNKYSGSKVRENMHYEALQYN